MKQFELYFMSDLWQRRHNVVVVANSVCVGAQKAGAVGQGVTVLTGCCETFGYGLSLQV